tara:strand:+ start:327 stop:677 length:351 start_codon:yes stop_codon:yes gene_type:complete
MHREQEVFHVSSQEARYNSSLDEYTTVEDTFTEEGWYWWTCLPGCLPDSEPFGPFATEAEAIADAHWEGGYAALVAYKDTHGDCNVPASYVNDGGYRLGAWVSYRRADHKKEGESE